DRGALQRGADEGGRAGERRDGCHRRLHLARKIGRIAPVEQRVSLITLGVADLARARAFYEALGWVRGNDSDEVVFFRAGGTIVGLWSRAALAEDSGVVDHAGGGGGDPPPH